MDVLKLLEAKTRVDFSNWSSCKFRLLDFFFLNFFNLWLFSGSIYLGAILCLSYFQRNKVDELSILVHKQLIPLPDPDVLRKMKPNLAKTVKMKLDIHPNKILFVHCLQVVANLVAQHERISCWRTSEQLFLTCASQEPLIVITQRPGVSEIRKAASRIFPFERGQDARIMLRNLQARFEFCRL